MCTSYLLGHWSNKSQYCSPNKVTDGVDYEDDSDDDDDDDDNINCEVASHADVLGTLSHVPPP